jgi:phosphatidylserine/phosphatidylglycerophosphate/cardiolipin synthase-like enzyme
MMFETGSPVQAIQPYFLSQIDEKLDKTKPLEKQPAIKEITDQALLVGTAFSQFIAGATSTIDIAIYDFRLLDGPLTSQFVDAIVTAAQRGVTVRLAYDKTQDNPAQDPTMKAFEGAGGDPAPTGTEAFIAGTKIGAINNVHVLAISEEAIDPGSQIMHQKYIVRDAGMDEAAVLMGSANFTTDAWAIQENNILIIQNAKDLAAAYESDFNDLWKAKKLAGTGQGNIGQVSVGDMSVSYSFAPGEGAETEQAIADLVKGAKKRIRMASMVTSSQSILEALADQVSAGRDFSGLYDGPTTNPIMKKFQADPAGTPGALKYASWVTIKAKVVAKSSIPFTPNTPHNLMHDKILVVDDVVVTGSFNFSTNATHNAENVLRIESAELADQYATYVDGLVTRYR